MGNGVIQVNAVNFITVGLMAWVFALAANKTLAFVMNRFGMGGGAE